MDKGSFEDYLLDNLALFHIDPPDTSYQEGYFDALAYMADYFGVIKIADAPIKPHRPKFTVIEGGLKD
jgi:hypothetical protein